MSTFTLRILLVEDDPMLGEGLSISLKLENYDVTWKKSVGEGLEAFLTNKFELIILDIGLPDGEGTDLCKKIRDTNRDIGIIFLTAKTDEDTVVRGLELGANDFVKKPFSHRELMARVKAILRAKFPGGKELKVGELTLFPEKRSVSYKTESITVNRRQFDILSYFMTHKDQIITRDQLLSHLNSDGDVFDRTIDSHVSQLRKILKSHNVNEIQITSVYGIGYRLESVE